jgi:hypothetical protein
MVMTKADARIIAGAACMTIPLPRVSRPAGFHRQPLSERCVNLSAHTAGTEYRIGHILHNCYINPAERDCNPGLTERPSRLTK